MTTAEIALEASDLGTGESRYLDCPFCGRKDKFSITRTAEGVLYHCFSANCGAAGFVPDHGSIPQARGKKTRPRKRYIGNQQKITKEDWKFFRERFHIWLADIHSSFTPNGAWEIFVTHRGEYIFPILDLKGLRVGEVIRQPTWEGCHREPVPGKPKALTYIDHDALRISVHKAKTDMVVLVEDQVSAEKVRSVTGYTAIAILGNTLSSEAALKIAGELKPQRLVWWLDEDMAETSYRLNARYGGYFNDSRVLVTPEDPKDTPKDDMKEVLFD